MAFFLLGGGVLRASDHASKADSLELKVHFPQDHRYIYMDYKDNRASLDSLAAIISRAKEAGTLESIEVRAYASPEGRNRLNFRLASARTDQVVKYISKRCGISSDFIEQSSGGIGWDVLRDLISDSDVWYRDEVINILDNVPLWVFDDEGEIVGGLYGELFSLHQGKVWKDMCERFFPEIRCGLVIVVRERQIEKVDNVKIAALPAPTAPCMTGIIMPLATPAPYSDIVEPSPKDEKDRRYFMAVKTNALAYAAGITNGAVEVNICPHLSFNLPVYYSAWNYFTETIKFRTLFTQPELRYWFNEHNDGFFLGAHFGAGSYNIAVDGEYRIQDHAGKKPALGGGIGVGFRMPFTSSFPRLKLEFSIGAGAYDICYDRFHNTDNTTMGAYYDTVHKTYWGLDGISVSVVYMFNFKKNSREGSR